MCLLPCVALLDRRWLAESQNNSPPNPLPALRHAVVSRLLESCPASGLHSAATLRLLLQPVVKAPLLLIR